MAEMVSGNTADGNLAATPGRGHLRASHADREEVINTLKVAFAQRRLPKDEFDARISQALMSRTYADLAAVVVGLPAERAAAQQPRPVSRPPMSAAARWAASGLVTPAVFAAASAADSLPGDSGYSVAAVIVAAGYLIFWLSAGADMLREWQLTGLPAARTCVRCAHSAASHRTRASCVVWTGLPEVRRCPCAGYVPQGYRRRPARQAPSRA